MFEDQDVDPLGFILRTGGFSQLVKSKTDLTGLPKTHSGDFGPAENILKDFIQSFSESGCVIPSDDDMNLPPVYTSLEKYFQYYPYRFSRKYDVKRRDTMAFDIYDLHLAIVDRNIHNFEPWTYYILVPHRELHFGFKTEMDLMMAKMLT